MPYGVSPTGFVKKPLLTIRTEIIDNWKANISAGINTAEDSLETQFAGSFAEQLAEAWDAQEAEYASRDPAQAEGQALDDLLSVRGVYRLPPQESLVTVTLNLDAGVYAAGDLVASVSGDPTARFANDVEITAPGGVLTNVLFRSEETGPVAAPSGLLTTIANPITGFNSVTNPSDAILGNNGESDEDFYARSELELGAEGSTTGDSIRAALLKLEGVRYARVYVNDEPTTDANGVLGNAVEAVVLGGDDQLIRDTLLAKKAAGIRAVGSDTGTAADSQGNVYAINFTRPATVQPYIEIHAYVDPNLYPGDAAMEAFIIDWADSNLSVGMDVVNAKLKQLVMSQPGLYDTNVFVGAAPSPGTEVNFVVGVREIADLDSSRVAVFHFDRNGPA